MASLEFRNLVGRSIALVVPAALIATGATPGHARDKQQPKPEIFTKLLNCREITDNQARLSCYDNQVNAMATASANDEVVVLDKEELKKTRRSLFGFAFPRLPFLGGGDDDDDKGAKAAQVEEITAKIERATSLGYGKWELKLDDGSTWQTTEAIPNRSPKSGQEIVIKRAAIGSFMGRVNGWTGVRMKRVG
ncbi:MAG: hypothetical protein U5M50_01645 [Sphingobium sp.]|nr:hypothetical protein [Sphingobium sp.]